MQRCRSFPKDYKKIVDEDNLESTYPYLDDVTIAANSLPELREKLKRFEESCKKRNMTINESKSVREADCLNILGYQIKHQQISPDPDRLKPLMDIPVPSTTKELKRVRGLVAYYSKWIANFSTKILNYCQKLRHFHYQKNLYKCLNNFEKN